MSLAIVGLVFFIVVAVGDVLVLIVDGILTISDEPTITYWLRRHRSAAVVAVALQLVAALGLALHLWG